MKESVFLVKEVVGIYCQGSNVLLFGPESYI